MLLLGGMNDVLLCISYPSLLSVTSSVVLPWGMLAPTCKHTDLIRSCG